VVLTPRVAAVLIDKHGGPPEAETPSSNSMPARRRGPTRKRMISEELERSLEKGPGARPKGKEKGKGGVEHRVIAIF
jgi:hypothetical protein